MSQFSAQDYTFMAQAIQLARQGQYTSAPNPNVGCVIVKDDIVLGKGFHYRAGEGHAEVRAIADALERHSSIAGATCYVTLEPCCHYGRTPPCAQALIDHQIKRVVMAMRDPNPKVAGGGKALLERSGIAVESGLLHQQAELLNQGFLSRMRRGRPFLRLKTAISLDGRTALANGESQWITSSASRQDVQRERARSHAILSSAQTVMMDDASLNVRSNELGSLAEKLTQPLRQPIRVIIDRRQQLTGKERLFALPGPIIRVVDRPAVKSLGTTLEVAPSEHWLKDVLDALTQYEINDIWSESGAQLSGALLAAQLVDELVIYQAGMVLGDKARAMLCFDSLTQLADASRWTLISQRLIGNEQKFIYQQKEVAE